MAAYALENSESPFHFEESLQKVFRLAAIAERRPYPQGRPHSFRDGTCVYSHSSPYGHKVCKCMESRIARYSCKRHFSAPDAHWGWDNDKAVFYFRHTLYMLCFHNADFGIDILLHIRFLDARHHDSISDIISLREFRMDYVQ